MNSAGYINNKNLIVKGDRVILFVVLLYVIITLRDIGLLGINFDLVTLICVIFFIFSPLNDIIKTLLFLLPFAGGLFFHELILVSFFVVLFKVLAEKEIKPSFILCVFIGFFIGLENYIVEAPVAGMVEEVSAFSLKLAIYISLVSIIVYYSYKLEVATILKYFVFGTALSFVNVFYSTLATYPLDYIIKYGTRLGQVSGSAGAVTSYDSNALGLFSLTAIAMVYLLSRTKHIKALHANILMTGLALVGVFTISRTFFLLLAILLIYMLSKSLKRKGLIRLLVFVLVFIVVFIIFFRESLLFNYIVHQYGSRFTNGNVISLGNRSEIFSQYSDIYFRSIKLVFFGAGIQGYKLLNNGYATHNGFQEVFLAWGFLGTAMIFAWITNLVTEVSKNRGNALGLEPYIPLIFFTIYIQTLQWFSINIYILLTAVMFLATRLKIRRNE